MIPKWFKDSYTEQTSKWVTKFALLGGPIFQLGIFFVDRVEYGYYQWKWDAIMFTWGFYLLIFLPASYLMRNTK
jgi:hypothetical protein